MFIALLKNKHFLLSNLFQFLYLLFEFLTLLSLLPILGQKISGDSFLFNASNSIENIFSANKIENIIVFFILGVSYSVFRFASKYYTISFSKNIVTTESEKLINFPEKLLLHTLDLKVLRKIKNMIIHDAKYLNEGLEAYATIVPITIMIFINLAFLLYFSKLLFFISFLLFIFLFLIYKNHAKKMNIEINSLFKNSELSNNYISEYLDNYLHLKTSNYVHIFLPKTVKTFFNKVKNDISIHNSRNLFTLFYETTGFLYILVFLLVFNYNNYPLEIAIIFLAIFFRVSPKIIHLKGAMLKIQLAKKFLSQSESIYTSEDRQTNQLKNIHNISTISLRNLNISFNNKTILKDINYTFDRGVTYCISGISGIGKTSLLRSLIGIIHTHNTVYYDDISINEIQEDSIIRKLTYIAQDTPLFKVSLEENIILSKEMNNQRYSEALELAHLNRDLDVENVSYGEKQRILMARAFYQKSQLIILDEVFSNLDYKTEDYIFRNFETIKNDSIIIYITHREHTFNFADKKIKIEDANFIKED